MKTWEFKKMGTLVTVGTPWIGQDKRPRLPWKVEGYENSSNVGSGFFNGDYNPEKGLLTFMPSFDAGIIDPASKGKKCGGFKLPQEVMEEINQIIRAKLARLNDEETQIVAGLMSGAKPINFSVVGCDYPHYQAWIRPIPNESDAQQLMDRAVKEFFRSHGLIPPYYRNICDYLGSCLKNSLPELQAPHRKATNIQHDPKVLEYHGYPNEVVTGFDVTLPDLIGETLGKIKEAQEKAAADEAAKKAARAEFQVKNIERGVSYGEEDDPYATVRLTSQTGENIILVARNIFDFGYVVNRVKGGLAVKDKQSGKWFWNCCGLDGQPERIPMTDLEVRAIKYLHKFPPISKEIRM